MNIPERTAAIVRRELLNQLQHMAECQKEVEFWSSRVIATDERIATLRRELDMLQSADEDTKPLGVKQ